MLHRRPRLYVYNRSTLAEIAFGPAATAARRNYELLLANGDTSTLGVPHKVKESMYPEGLLHRHFDASPGVALTQNASAADMFWVPLWPYAACTAMATCRALEGKDKWRCRANQAHLHQVLYDTCNAMRRVYAWLISQDTWRRRQGADHVFFLMLKDYLWRENRLNQSRRVSTQLLGNAVFATTEDRLPYPQLRSGCTTAVTPYYANSSVWGSGLSFQQLVARKRNLLGFFGNSAGYRCHLLKGSYPVPRNALTFGGPMCNNYRANVVRKAVFSAVRLSGGGATKLRRNSSDGFYDAAALQDAVFCPHVVGDVYTSPRLYTAILAMCIPIVISDRVQLPFPAAVAWSSFTLRVPEQNVTRATGAAELVEMARRVSPARVETMQRALWRARALLTFHEQGPAADGRDALGLLTDELMRGVRCPRPILVEQLGVAPCMHGHTFGRYTIWQAHGLWVRGGCHGRFVSSECVRRRGQASACPAAECGGGATTGEVAHIVAHGERIQVRLCKTPDDA